ncbi:hypothetical protein pEaSNUABM5_00172 [Erwinia phage pEa_SNUABM_5]|uniref:Uncharacterized protein n=1 Tax=Erwinia phage pEa_SNUABM_5 TaxID=2797313 RepID=A0A7T8EQ31_9CAUD|nr:hypothetical protein MPK73_gp172 [Erwinia phage pEa_SNUABM_5]QQO90314.1 hypothetical protein pEaSNUABM5_00172 [Erwinia phage pEa_SNUABM_5]
MLQKYPKRLRSIPHADLKQAAAVEYNLELVLAPEMVGGQSLEYRANCYIHTGSHCRQLARQMRELFPDARRCAYRPTGSFRIPASSITTVFQFMVAQLE